MGLKKTFCFQLFSYLWIFVVLFTLLNIVISVGCQKKNQPKQTTSTEEISAREILNGMIGKYASATNYRDHAVFQLSYRLLGKPHLETHRYQTQWSRENGFHAKWFKSRITGKDKQLVCRIVDIPSKNMDGQVVLQQPGEVGTYDTIIEDPIARHFVCGTTDLPWAPDVQANPNDQIPATWSLLTGQHKPLWLRSHTGVELMSEKEIDGKPHYRLAVDTLLGEYIAWVNKESLILRRLEIPKEVMARELNYTSEVTRIQIVANFHDAEFDGKDVPETDVQRELRITDGEKPVRYFVTLPEKFPSRLIGSQVRNFKFQSLDGNDFGGPAVFDGKLTVMLWFSGVSHQLACEDFKKVCNRFAEYEDVSCFGVCADPANLAENQAVSQRAAEWKIDYPVVRDLNSVGGPVFDVRTLPSIVVVGTDGRIQFHTTGDDSEFISDTIVAVDRLKKGDDIAREMQEHYEDYLATYHKQLAALNPLKGNSETKAIEVKLRRKSQPENVQLTRAWRSDDLVAPGNIIVVGSGSQKRILANDGYRTIVELDSNGNVLARHALELPEGIAISWIRVATAIEGKKVFAAGSMMQPQFFVFDENWRNLFAYPEVAKKGSEIADVQFIKSNSNRPANLLVGFAKKNEIHRVSLTGKLIQTIDTHGNPVSMAATDSNNETILRATNKLAQIVEFDPTFQSNETELTASHLFSSQTLSIGNRPSILAVGNHDDSAMEVEIRDGEFQIVGSMELNPGSFREQVQFATYCETQGARQNGIWAVARPDSTIYLISAGGKLLDRFQYGKAIRGIALAEFEGQTSPQLIISTADGIAASHLRLPAGSQAKTTDLQLK